MSEERSIEDVTYLARDYEALRERLLDRLALVLPDWSSRFAPDVGVTLVELLAYLGDRLAYRQDAVATEAYVGTARRRISVQRHARLVDERLHDGCAARALLLLGEPARDWSQASLDGIAFLGGSDDPSRSGRALTELLSHAEVVFTRLTGLDTPISSQRLRLAAEVDVGAISATLCDGVPQVGSILVLQNEAHRVAHAVRLRSVERAEEGVRVSWSWDDRLPHAFAMEGTLVRSNVLCVEHGRPERERLRDDRRLKLAPITFTVPCNKDASVFELLRPDARRAIPAVGLRESASGVAWEWRRDLVSSAADDRHFTIEIDDEGYAHVRFGDGSCGRRPGDTQFDVEYRVGNGPAGNVRGQTIRRAAPIGRERPLGLESLTVEQPLAARGGTASEDVAALRSRLAFGARRELVRAVVPDDYARIAETHPRVQRAAAQMSSCGGCQIVRVAIDPCGANDLPDELKTQLERMLERVKLIGHEVQVEPARYVDVGIWLDVVVRADHSRVGVGSAILAKVRELFHPDRFSFGQPLYQSRFVSAVRSLGGVESIGAVDITRLNDNVGLDELGIVRVAPLEIARFEYSTVPRSKLELRLRGGR